MKFTKSQALLGVIAPFASAFPAAMLEAAVSDPAVRARAAEVTKLLAARQEGANSATAVFEPIPMFNEAEQFIDVSEGSGNEYQAPGPNDLRGPCPGLNACEYRLIRLHHHSLTRRQSPITDSFRVTATQQLRNSLMLRPMWSAWARYLCVSIRLRPRRLTRC